MQADQKLAAQKFVKRWQEAAGSEDAEARVFWIELLQDVLGIANPTHLLSFEHKIRGKKADVAYRDRGILIENKSRGIALDKQEKRGTDEYGGDRMVTPYEQAKWYADNIAGEKPRFLITCNFDEFWFYDTHEEYPEKGVKKLALADLPEQLRMLSIFTDKANSLMEQEKQVSMQAGALIGKLFDGLREQYHDPDAPESRHALNVLCMRLVFCLFCEDAGLFAKDAFLDYLRNTDPADMRMALKRLFQALNTPPEDHDPYDERTRAFPYVNGGLFAEEVEVPNFTEELKFCLLFEVSQQTDWSRISPTIFGGIFESTLNPETRRSGGMHYTSPENIHKVIDPLFLDGLLAEFEAIRAAAGITEKKRKARLQAFRDKIGSLHFLDPACGSGNFLTETYLCLRRLEDDVLRELNDGQVEISFDGLASDKRVTLDQFYGIEINDFAVRVAKTALWIAQLQANNNSEMLLDLQIEDFPLTDSANITCANALRTDWNDVLSAERCDYVMGNPPFYGARNQSKEQKAEILDTFHGAKNCGNVDYVAGWYIKAAEYAGDHPVRCAYVSTNSICQGEQVANVWAPIWALGMRIDFAHNTFRWSNEAANQARVFCVIVGFSKLDGTKRLFHHTSPDADAVELRPDNINAYLADAPDEFIWNRSKPLCDVPKMGIGNKPIDGGFYLFKPEEKDAFVAAEPGSELFFHRWLGSNEFINECPRWVLWLGDATSAQLKELPRCRERIQMVRECRLSSGSAPTRKLAEKPTRFHVENMPVGDSILVPEVSSERRRYIPMGFIGAETFCSNLVRLIPDATLYHYGILQSQFHNAWMRVVCGRLKSDYRYSAGLVYNNFVWPDPTAAQRAEIERCAQAVLDARELYPDSTLADMYDPDNDFLFPDLMAAHRALDAAVEAAYGVDFNGDEEAIVAHLFKLYAKATEGE